MIRIRSLVLGVLAVGSFFLSGCHHDQPQPPAPAPTAAQDQKMMAVALVRPSQAATTQPTDNNVTGTVTFTQTSDGISFVADVDGFAPNTKHGFHIHEKGDLTAPNLSSAGGHFNPTGEIHGGPNAAHHHLGDLGNLEADANGHAHLQGMVHDLTLTDGDHCIVGKSVIIHAKVDDLTSQPSGDSGTRIAGGTITMSK